MCDFFNFVEASVKIQNILFQCRTFWKCRTFQKNVEHFRSQKFLKKNILECSRSKQKKKERFRIVYKEVECFRMQQNVLEVCRRLSKCRRVSKFLEVCRTFDLLFLASPHPKKCREQIEEFFRCSSKFFDHISDLGTSADCGFQIFYDLKVYSIILENYANCP